MVSEYGPVGRGGGRRTRIDMGKRSARRKPAILPTTARIEAELRATLPPVLRHPAPLGCITLSNTGGAVVFIVGRWKCIGLSEDPIAFIFRAED
jgi:hypothetical protein